MQMTFVFRRSFRSARMRLTVMEAMTLMIEGCKRDKGVGKSWRLAGGMKCVIFSSSFFFSCVGGNEVGLVVPPFERRNESLVERFVRTTHFGTTENAGGGTMTLT